jgi:type II secretory pathway component GspD/PulD (secretin)
VSAVDTRTNSIIVRASPDVIAKIKDLLAKTIDVDPAKPTAGADNTVIRVIALKHIDGVAAGTALSKKSTKAKFVVDASSNKIILAGSPAAVTDAQKVIEEIDTAAGRKK